jgi:hypothetical protein
VRGRELSQHDRGGLTCSACCGHEIRTRAGKSLGLRDQAAWFAVGNGQLCTPAGMHEILKTQGNVAAQVERAMLSFVPCGNLLEMRLNR